MSKLNLSIFILFASFTLGIQARLPNQAQERPREVSTLKKYISEPGFPANFAVKANFGEKFNTSKAIGEKPTYMSVFISSSCSGFFQNFETYFENFDCKTDWCKADNSNNAPKYSANYPFISASELYNASIIDLSIQSTDGSEPWKLLGNAFWTDRSSPKIYNGPYFSHHRNLTNPKSWGWIGLGIDGDAIKNFQTEEPIFSVNVTGLGNGTIIFGKNTTLYNATRTPQIFPCDGNWTLQAHNLTLGPTINQTSNFNPNIIFDMNYEFIGVSKVNQIMDPIEVQFRRQYMTYNSSFQEYGYSYIYRGELFKLPSLTFGLGNGMNLTIPPDVYMKPIPRFPGYYTSILRTIEKSAFSQQWVVLGSSFLSKYYTVFNKPKDGEPQITLYPLFTASFAPEPTSHFFVQIIIWTVSVILIITILLKGKNKNISIIQKPASILELNANKEKALL